MPGKRHISEISAERFEGAVRACLDKKVASGLPFSVSEVIRDSKYENGTNVGETTIYAKSPDGTYVHTALLDQLKAKSVRSRVKKKKRHPLATELRQPGRKDNAIERTSALDRQLIEQENQLQELEVALGAAVLRAERWKEDLYVALTVLGRLTQGGVLDVVRGLRELDGQVGLDSRIKLKALSDQLAQQCLGLVGKS